MNEPDLTPEAQQEIIQKFKSGDKEIFSEVYNIYYEQIFKFLLRRTGNAENAYDLTAETFFKAFDTFHKFQWRGVSLKSWLFRIGCNKLKNYYRSHKRIKIHPLENIPEGLENMADEALEELRQAEEEIQKNEKLKKARKYISKLNPTYQTAVSLKYSSDLSLKEIARSMSKSESAVKSILHRAIKKLRAMGLEATLCLLFYFLYTIYHE